MRAEILQLAAELSRQGKPFVLATVVRREPYSSAHPGDLAVITADGGFHGWLGGSCTAPTVKREAKAALADGQPRLLALSPDPASQERPGVTALPMTCLSGATVEIFLEPMLPAPRVVVFGLTPQARAFARLGRAMGYLVDVVDPDADPDMTGVDRVFQDLDAPELKAPAASTPSGLFVLVATMGEYDEDAIAAALALEPTYLGVVASPRRFSSIRETLLGRGFPASVLERIRNPAGLDLGGKRPEEQALSVIAEIVRLRQSTSPSAQPAPREAAAEAIDPVCGMTVTIAGARHQAVHEGQPVYFCNPRCKEKFLAEPGRYLNKPHERLPERT